MAKCAWAVLCRKSVVDTADNTISLFEILENINFPEPPREELYKDRPALIAGNTPEVAHLVSMWWRDDENRAEQITVRVQIVGPAKKPLYQQVFEISLLEHERTRHILRFPGLFYAGPGRYSYLLQQKQGTNGKARWVNVAHVLMNMGKEKTIQPTKRRTKKSTQS
jgi:hypothetical protein